MSKKLQLSIPKPCHEDWDAMTQVEKGKFCGSCQKQVLDFSNMNDRQVAEFFKKPSTGSVCGRFMTDQLERDIEIPKKRIPWLKYFFQFAIPAFLVSIKASGQATKGKIKVNTVVSDTTSRPICDRPTMGIIARPINDLSDERGIVGNVVDAKTGNPLPAASVVMISTIGKENIRVKEDASFMLDIYRKITVQRIEISCPGYEKKVLTFHVPSDCVPCIKQYALTYEKLEHQEVITGDWGGVTMNNYTSCPPGKITLSRVAESDFEHIKEIKVDTGIVRLDFYDNAQIDGDTISVLLNNKTIVSNQRLAAKPITVEIKIDLTHTEQEVTMVAENLGEIPPNTALLIITAGKKRYQLYLASTDKKNAQVRIIYEKPETPAQ